jgi:hypothetical protein
MIIRYIEDMKNSAGPQGWRMTRLGLGGLLENALIRTGGMAILRSTVGLGLAGTVKSAEFGTPGGVSRSWTRIEL